MLKSLIFKIVFISAGAILLPLSSFSQTDSISCNSSDSQLSLIENPDDHSFFFPQKSAVKYRESKRFVAAFLCLTLGPFGMHRLYLGSTPQVAAAYSVTLGAVGIVPVVDLLFITFSKDISRFKDNGKVIMWGKK